MYDAYLVTQSTEFFWQAHAKVWHTYDAQWRNKQKGRQTSDIKLSCLGTNIKTVLSVPAISGMVGISLSADWGEPVDVTNQRDIEAAERYVQFHLGWFATPLFNGDYPQIMKDYVGK